MTALSVTVSDDTDILGSSYGFLRSSGISSRRGRGGGGWGGRGGGRSGRSLQVLVECLGIKPRGRIVCFLFRLWWREVAFAKQPAASQEIAHRMYSRFIEQVSLYLKCLRVIDFRFPYGTLPVSPFPSLLCPSSLSLPPILSFSPSLF